MGDLGSIPELGRSPGKEKGTEKIFEELIAENFPKMGKEIVNQVQEAQRVPGRINPRRNTPRHIVIKLKKTQTEIDKYCTIALIESENTTK